MEDPWHVRKALFSATASQSQLLNIYLSFLSKPALFYPPLNGLSETNIDYLKSRGYTIVKLSSIQSEQTFGGVRVETAVQFYDANLNSNSMLFFNEANRMSSELLTPRLISLVQDRGFTLKTVDQCLQINPYQVTGGAYQARDASWKC